MNWGNKVIARVSEHYFIASLKQKINLSNSRIYFVPQKNSFVEIIFWGNLFSVFFTCPFRYFELDQKTIFYIDLKLQTYTYTQNLILFSQLLCFFLNGADLQRMFNISLKMNIKFYIHTELCSLYLMLSYTLPLVH